MESFVNELKLSPHKNLFKKISKFEKENKTLDEKVMKNLENSTPENFVLSIYFAIIYKDKKRILKAFEHPTKSTKWAVINGIDLFDDETLENLILSQSGEIRRMIIRKQKSKRPKLISKFFEKLYLLDHEEAFSVLPFLLDDEILKMMEKYNFGVGDLKRATYSFTLEKKELTFKLFLENKEDLLNNGKLVTSLIKIKEDDMFNVIKETGLLGQYYLHFKKKENYYKSVTLIVPVKRLPKRFMEKLKSEELENMFNHYCKNNSINQFLSGFSKKTFAKFYSRVKIDLFEALKNETKPDLLSILPSDIGNKLADQFLSNVEEKKRLTSREKIPFLKKQDISKVRNDILNLCSDSDPNNRIQGYHCLIDSTDFSNKEFDKTIEFLIKKMKTEQDPVKISVFPHIRNPGFFKDENSLEALVTPSFDSVDRSNNTFQQIYQLCIYVFNQYKTSDKHCSKASEIIFTLLNKNVYYFDISGFNVKTGKDIEIIFKYFPKQMEQSANVGFLSKFKIKHKLIDETIENIIVKCESKFRSLIGLITNIFHQEALQELSPFLNYHLKEKKNRLEKVKRLLNITSLLLQYPIITNTIIEGDVTFFLDTLDAYVSRFNTYPFFFDIIPKYKKIFNNDERKRIIKYMINGYQFSLKSNTGYSSHFIRTIGKIQIGKLDSSLEEFIQSVEKSTDLKISQASLSFYSSLDIIDGKRIFSFLNEKTVGVIFGSTLKRAMKSSKNFEKEVLNFISSDQFLKNGVTVQKEILKTFLKSSTPELLKALLGLWKIEKLHKDVKVIVASLLKKFLTYDDQVDKIYEEISSSSYLPLIYQIFTFTNTSTKQRVFLSKLQLKTLKSNSVDVSSYGIANISISLENSKSLFESISEILLTFPKDKKYTNNLLTIIGNCLIKNSKLADHLYALTKETMSKDKNEGNPSPQRSIIRSLFKMFETSIEYELSENLIQFFLENDETYLKECLRLYGVKTNLFSYVEKCQNLKLKSLSSSFILKIGMEILPTIKFEYENPEKLAKIEDPEVLMFVIHYFTKCQYKEIKKFLKSKKGAEFINSLKNHKNGEIRFMAFNLNLDEKE